MRSRETSRAAVGPQPLVLLSRENIHGSAAAEPRVHPALVLTFPYPREQLTNVPHPVTAKTLSSEHPLGSAEP